MKKWLFPVVLGVAAIPLLGLYAYGVWRQLIPLHLAALAYTVMSLITLAAYHHDKCSAVAGGRRIPEALLHLLELLGGWPGALLAQLAFRHKLKKGAFQLVFWLIVAVHCAVWFAVRAENTLRRAQALLPKSLTAYFTDLPQISLPQINLSNLLASSGSNTTNDAPRQPETASTPPAPATTNAPSSLMEVWASDPATEPLINDPNVRRSRVSAHKQSRMLIGEIKAVSPSHGLLLSLPPEIGGDGVIAPSALVDDFYRRFRVGEQVVVAVKGVSMKGSQKQLDLLLVEP